MRVNSSGPACRVRSVYGTVRLPPPQPVTPRSTATLIHVHRLAVRIRREEPRRDPHRNANTAMARRVRRNGGVAVDCIATGEVHRVVEGSERAGVEADHLAVDGEAPDRRVRAGDTGGR